MAITYGFYNSRDGDKKYTAEQMSAIFDFLITDGVLETYGGKFFTVPATQGLGVLVKPGWAWFDETWTQSDAEIHFLLDGPDISLSRIDTVVIETNKTELVRQNNVKVVRGVPAVSPIPQPLENTSAIHNHPIAYITVPSGATAIRTQDIEILVGKNPCPFITSVLQATDITGLFAKWEGQFTEWFENIQQVLSEEVVTNLQLQIDQRVKIADKATAAEAQAGTNDTKWMTPAKVRSSIKQNKVDVGEIVTAAYDISKNNTSFHICDGTILSGTEYSALASLLKFRYGMPYTTTVVNKLTIGSFNSKYPTSYYTYASSPNGTLFSLRKTGSSNVNGVFGGYVIRPTGQIIEIISTITAPAIGNNAITYYLGYWGGSAYFALWENSIYKITDGGVLSLVISPFSAFPKPYSSQIYRDFASFRTPSGDNVLIRTNNSVWVLNTFALQNIAVQANTSVTFNAYVFSNSWSSFVRSRSVVRYKVPNSSSVALYSCVFLGGKYIYSSIYDRTNKNQKYIKMDTSVTSIPDVSLTNREIEALKGIVSVVGIYVDSNNKPKKVFVFVLKNGLLSFRTITIDDNGISGYKDSVLFHEQTKVGYDGLISINRIVDNGLWNALIDDEFVSIISTSLYYSTIMSSSDVIYSDGFVRSLDSGLKPSTLTRLHLFPINSLGVSLYVSSDVLWVTNSSSELVCISKKSNSVVIPNTVSVRGKLIPVGQASNAPSMTIDGTTALLDFIKTK